MLLFFGCDSDKNKYELRHRNQIQNGRFSVNTYVKDSIEYIEVVLDDTAKWIREYNKGNIVREYYKVNDRYEQVMTVYKNKKVNSKTLYLDNAVWSVDRYFWSSDHLDSIVSFRVDSVTTENEYWRYIGKILYNKDNTVDTLASEYYLINRFPPLFYLNEYNTIKFSIYSNQPDHFVQLLKNDGNIEEYYAPNGYKTIMVLPEREGYMYYRGRVLYCTPTAEDTLKRKCSMHVFVVAFYAINREDVNIY